MSHRILLVQAVRPQVQGKEVTDGLGLTTLLPIAAGRRMKIDKGQVINRPRRDEE